MGEKRDIEQELVNLMKSGVSFSDVHIDLDQPVMIKVAVGWTIAAIPPVSRLDIEEMLLRLDNDWEHNIGEHAISRPINLGGCRFRIMAYLTCAGNQISISIRKQHQTPPAFADTGLPYSVHLMANMPRGLILVAGATSAGKSTTIATMVEIINQTRALHILTVEDPIEYQHIRAKAIITQREVGSDVQSFSLGLAEAMRQCPDVIVVGEILDRETAETCLMASESGHLVIASLHASSAVGATQKLLGFFHDYEHDSRAMALANTLVGVVFQMLVPAVDKRSRVLATEILYNGNQQYSKLIGDRDKLEQAFLSCQDGSNQTLASSLTTLVKDGKITKVEALRAVTYNQHILHEQLKALGGGNA